MLRANGVLGGSVCCISCSNELSGVVC